MKIPFRFGILVALLITASCGDYQQEIYEDIGPNETGFYVPLEGKTTDGGKFDSLEVVERMKVAAKRITIPTRKLDTGRLYWDYKWIPTGRVVKVHRAATTCEWTNEDDTGTSDKNEALSFGSRDGIAFHLGFTATAHVDEEHAAKYLYNWGDRDLKIVLDTNVRSSLQTALTKRFGSHPLAECLSQFTEISTDAARDVMTEFIERGVTIDFMGPQGKPVLENKAIQLVIDERFSSENAKQIAQNQAAAQIEQNRQLVEKQRGIAEMSVIDAEAAAKVQIAKAKGEAESKKAIAEAEAFQILQVAQAEAKGNTLRAEALNGTGGSRLVALRQIEQWKGNLPSFLLSGNQSGTSGIPFILNIPSEALTPSK